MNTNVKNRILDYLSNKYLNLAEMLPTFNGGFIADLQNIRKVQREQSKKLHEMGRAPEGVELEFLFFRIFELFHYEEFNQLLDKITNLFPGHTNEDVNRLELQDFIEDSKVTGIKQLGYIVREGEKRPIVLKPHHACRKVPPEIDYLEVELHKILPSMVIITVDAHLTPLAQSRLLEFKSKYYLPKVRLKSIFPSPEAGFSMDILNAVESTYIAAWFENLRAGVEHIVKPHLGAYFFYQNHKRKIKLPAIEVFAIKGISEQISSFKDSIKQHRTWYESFGFNLVSYYQADNLILSLHEERYKGDSLTTRVIFMWPLLASSLNIDVKNTQSLFHEIKFVIQDLLPYTVIFEYLNSVGKSVEKLRKDISINSRSKSFKSNNLSKLITLYDKHLQENLPLERALIELDQYKDILWRGMFSRIDLSGLQLNHSGNSHFKDDILGYIKSSTEVIKKYANLIDKSLSTYLSMRNIQVTYRLQVVFLFLTIVTLGVAIIGIIINWPDVQKFIITPIINWLF